MIYWFIAGLLAAIVFLLIHHTHKHGHPIDLSDIDDHETIEFFLGGVALGLYLSTLI